MHEDARHGVTARLGALSSPTLLLSWTARAAAVTSCGQPASLVLADPVATSPSPLIRQEVDHSAWLYPVNPGSPTYKCDLRGGQRAAGSGARRIRRLWASGHCEHTEVDERQVGTGREKQDAVTGVSKPAAEWLYLPATTPASGPRSPSPTSSHHPPPWCGAGQPRILSLASKQGFTGASSVSPRLHTGPWESHRPVRGDRSSGHLGDPL